MAPTSLPTGIHLSIFTTLALFIFALMTIGIDFASTWSMAPHPTLEQDLMRRYDRRHRPVKKEASTMSVQVHLIINHIEKVDEHEQTMLLHGTISAIWVDEYLQWTPSQYNGTYSLPIDTWKIWQPSFALYNSARANYWLVQMSGMPATVTYQGRVIGVGSFSFQVTCLFDFSAYPFDEQHCPIVLADWIYDLSKVNLTHMGAKPPVRLSFDPLSESPKRHVAGWEVLDTWQKSCYWGPNGCAERFPTEGLLSTYWSMLEFGVRIKRHYSYYFLVMALPTLITALITLLLFWLESLPLAIWVGVFNLLLQYVYGWNVIKQLPPGNGSVPTIAKIYATNMLSTLLALALHIIMNFILSQQQLLGKKEEWQLAQFIPPRFKGWINGLMASHRFFTLPGLSFVGRVGPSPMAGYSPSSYVLYGEDADAELENPPSASAFLSFDNPLLESDAQSAKPGENSSPGVSHNRDGSDMLIEMEPIPFGITTSSSVAAKPLIRSAPVGGGGVCAESNMVELNLDDGTQAQDGTNTDDSESTKDQNSELVGMTAPQGDKEAKRNRKNCAAYEDVHTEKTELQKEFQLLRRLLFAFYLLCLLVYYLPFLIF